MREREGLIGWIRQIRRTAESSAPRKAPAVDPDRDRVRALEARVSHLEQLVQGLQDSVHREFSRQEKRITDLEARVQPGALGKALSEDARARGL